jgi:transcriptional regulator with XRE-family HTH domain
MEEKNYNRIYIGNLIKDLRISKNKNLKELSEEISGKENTLKRIEEGKFSFDVDLLFLILKKLQLTLEIDGKKIDI